MSDLDDMVARAQCALERSYSPYSGFPVGVCIRAASGRLYAGCNVENASFPEGQCAEAVALGAMVLGGDLEIAEVVVLTRGPRPCPPCGGCRQRLDEFASPDTVVHMLGPGGSIESVALADLLPRSFGSQHLAEAAPRERTHRG